MWWLQIIINLIQSLSVWLLQIIINLTEPLSVWWLYIIINLTESLSVWLLQIIINLTESLSVWRLQIIINLTEPLSVWWIKRCYRSSVMWLNHFYCEGSMDFTNQHQSDWIAISMMDQTMWQININLTESLSVWWIKQCYRSLLIWLNHFQYDGSIDFTDQHQSDWIIVSMMDQAMLQIIINMTESLSIWWINRFDRSSLIWLNYNYS